MFPLHNKAFNFMPVGEGQAYLAPAAGDGGVSTPSYSNYSEDI